MNNLAPQGAWEFDGLFRHRSQVGGGTAGSARKFVLRRLGESAESSANSSLDGIRISGYFTA
jgi:hypothetical protein